MVVIFDSTGLERVDETTWAHPTSGDWINLKLMNSPLTEPAWLENIPAMRRNLAVEYARMGCLIEAEPVELGGVRGSGHDTVRGGGARGRPDRRVRRG